MLTFSFEGAIAVYRGGSEEAGLALSFPTKADPTANWDFGAFNARSDDLRGLLGEGGSGFSLAKSGDVQGMAGPGKISVFPLVWLILNQ